MNTHFAVDHMTITWSETFFVKVKMPNIIRYGVVQLWSKRPTLEITSYRVPFGVWLTTLDNSTVIIKCCQQCIRPYILTIFPEHPWLQPRSQKTQIWWAKYTHSAVTLDAKNWPSLINPGQIKIWIWLPRIRIHPARKDEPQTAVTVGWLLS